MNEKESEGSVGVCMCNIPVYVFIALGRLTN